MSDNEVILSKVAAEEAWAYQRRGERLSWTAMAELATLPIEQGGLGYRISPKTLRDRSDSYFKLMAPVIATTAEERRARQQHELDELARIARDAIGRAAYEGKTDHGAMKILLEVQKREAALHGLDAAARVDVDIHDDRGRLDELNAELAALGLEPVSDPVDAELNIMLSRIPGRSKATETDE